MAITVNETGYDRSGHFNDRRLRYIVQGTADDQTALANVLATAPFSWHGLQRGDVEIRQAGPTIYYAEVPYGLSQPLGGDLDSGEVSFSFQLGSESQHIRYSLETITKVAATGVAIDFKQAINVTPKQDDIEGMDISVPTTRFMFDFRIPQANITDAYLRVLEDIAANPVNQFDWRGREAGTLRIEGISGRINQDGDTTLSFTFQYRPNRKDVKVGGLPAVDVDGWDILWVYYAPQKDANANILSVQPLCGYVERVYGRSNFASLGF